MRRLLHGLLVVSAIATATPPPRTPAPTPAPNLLAPVLAETLVATSAGVADSQEWMVIQAARVIDDWKTMSEQAEKLIRRFPDEADAYAALGAALEGLARRADATAALGRAVELKPGLKGAWLMLAILRSASGEHGEAAAAFEHGLAFAPTDARLLWGAALAYARAGDHARAAPAFARLVAAYPGDVDAWVAYAPEALAAHRTDEMWAAFNALRAAHPDIAARVGAAVPADVRAALPTPVPPTPRATSRPDAPRLVMGGGAAGATGRSPMVWSATALAFESKVKPIAEKARPLTEMMERYAVSCRGGRPARSSGSAPGEEGATPVRQASAAGTVVDWASVWARTPTWATAAATDGTAECRALAAEMLALANGTRAAVEAAVKETAGSGISDAERNLILEKYGLRW